MGIQELIQRLRTESLRADRCTTQIMDLCMEAAEILECVFSGTEDGEINLCLCCKHIAHMDQCKMDVGCSRCGETGCPCQNCHGGRNWERNGAHETELLPINSLTPEEIKAIDYDKVWISYGESGEWGIVVDGLLYSIDALEGAGFVDMLQDAVQGEDVTRPTGGYKLYRWPSATMVPGSLTKTRLPKTTKEQTDD